MFRSSEDGVSVEFEFFGWICEFGEIVLVDSVVCLGIEVTWDRLLEGFESWGSDLSWFREKRGFKSRFNDVFERRHFIVSEGEFSSDFELCLFGLMEESLDCFSTVIDLIIEDLMCEFISFDMSHEILNFHHIDLRCQSNAFISALRDEIIMTFFFSKD